MVKIVNLRQKEILADRVHACDRFWPRLRGLLGRPPLTAGEACWIKPCKAVHTFGMTYPLDLYFLDRESRVVGFTQAVKPNRLSPLFWQAHSVLEFASGTRRDCQVGDQLSMDFSDEK